MSLGLLGKKIGMEAFYDADGNRHGVTLVQSGPCVILQIKDAAKEGYTAVQVGFDAAKEKQTNRAKKGHFAKAKTTPVRFIKEFRVSSEIAKTLEIGKTLPLDLFKAKDWLDVTGISKGKGFAGVVKRYGMKGHPATHGTHEYFRHPGSAGCRFPQGTIKGKRNPGHMGVDQVTVQNLQLLEIRDGKTADDKVLAIAGAIPGNRGGYLVINKAVKLN